MAAMACILVVACGADSGVSESTPPGDSESTTASATVVDSTMGETTSTTVPLTTVPPTTTQPDATSVLGTRESPVPVGEIVELGDWRLRVAGVTPDATDQVLEENQFNEPPAEGRQFFMVHLEATYIGQESSNFWVDVSMKVVGPSNVAYESFEDSCGVIPDPIDDSGETFPGGSISGNACWSVSAEDAHGLVLIVEPGFSFDDTRAFLSLDPAAEPSKASTAEGVEGSSRLADAVPVGEAAAVGPWTLAVVEVIPDATQLVLAENRFNEPPEEGRQFYMARLEATFDGTESSTFWVDMSLKAVGDSSVAYEGFDGSCGVIPDPIDEAGETFPGGSISGNVCWNVWSEDVGSLVMIAEESFTFDENRVFFSLTPDS
ncbi:MAG TPA: hypothetical protein VF377_09490 [Acidimicrobiia bacterium]